MLKRRDIENEVLDVAELMEEDSDLAELVAKAEKYKFQLDNAEPYVTDYHEHIKTAKEYNKIVREFNV